MENTKEPQRLSFYTIGKDFTVMVRDLVSSGQFYNAISILRDGGLKNHHILTFLVGNLEFEGDTREGDHTLSINILDNESNFEFLKVGWFSLISSIDLVGNIKPYNFHYIKRRYGDNNHIKALFEILTPDALASILAEEILEREGYTLHKEVSLEKLHNGVFLENGWFVEIGYQMHRDLYPVLYNLGLSNVSDWTDSGNNLVHISSSQLHGEIAANLEYPIESRVTATEEQLKSLMDWKEHFPTLYGYNNHNVADVIREYTITTLNKGAKYGNLEFLRKYYNFNLPKISLEPLDSEYCIRTSPKYSIAGLLNSKFDITEDSEKEIWEDWEKFKDVKKNNSLSLFYQEYIEGVNGVAHYIKEGDFNYAVSSVRGDVVNGKVGADRVIDVEPYREIRRIARQLHNDLGKQIQLEFVVTDEGKVYIVQLRTLELPDEDTVNPEKLGDIIVTGNSFTKGYLECKLEDVLIVDEDAESEQLLGKKALIVRNDVEFSHILALSQSLNIPSIYGIGDIELPNKFILETNYRTGYIFKIK